MENISATEEAISYLNKQSIYFSKLYNDQNFLYQEINNLSSNPNKIKELITAYSKPKIGPVVALRLILLKELEKKTTINENLVNNIKKKIEEKNSEFLKKYLNDVTIKMEKENPFSSWKKSFNILYAFIYNGKYENEITKYLKIIGNYLKSELDLPNYEIDETGYKGPRNQGQNKSWVNIFPSYLRKYNNAISYFIEFENGKLFSGLSKADNSKITINIPNELGKKEYTNIDAIINQLKQCKKFEQEQNKKIHDAINSHKYWSAGILWDKEDKFREFNKNRCWKIGWAKEDPKGKKTWENIKHVSIGDYIIFKTTPWGKKIRVKQISTVTGKNNNTGEIYFEPLIIKDLYIGEIHGNLGGTLSQITDYQDIENIFGDLIFMKKENINSLAEQYKELLKRTHNIILHGAPGTGKTHLAKDIAKAMEAETEFVQFHPSYDYTDFVEGLRPVKNDNDTQIGFERKDGIFKELCKAALENLENSNKSKEEIKKETIITENIDNFLNNAIENETEFETEQNTFVIDDLTDTHIIIIATNKKDKTKEYKRILQKVNLQTLLEQDKSVTAIKEIKDIVDRKSARAEDSYLLALYKGIKNILQTKQDIKDASIPENKRKNYVLIIDEINRGDFSKIFGELFFSIDPGYRGKDGIVKTQYQNLIKKENKDKFVDGFYVPENVYIIGTMNDIDRNVESMDFAFRRRFTFVEIKAQDTAGEILAGLKNPELIADCKNIMTKLNAKISEIKELGSPDDYHIGAAYFLKLPDLNNNYKKLWDYHLSGLLKEYFRGLEKDYLTEIENEYNKLIGYVETSNEGQ